MLVSCQIGQLQLIQSATLEMLRCCVKLYYCLYSSKNLTTPHGRELNPPDLWIHGTVAEVDDKMSDYERNSMARPSSRAARSDRTGSFSCCIYNRIFIVFI